MATLEATATGLTIRRAKPHATTAERSSASAIADDVQLYVMGNCRARALPVEKSVAGGVIDQKIDLIVDPAGIMVGRAPVRIGSVAVDEALTNCFPGVDGALHVLRGADGTSRLRARGSDLEILRQRYAEIIDFTIEGGALLRIGGDEASREGRAHSGEVARRSARLIDRHQRPVERLVDEHAGILDAHDGVTADRSGDHAHD
ncbi:MAG: hypothetical protein WBD90_04245, partial [Xanthobacteraceae bacterium]